ncbi:hypothetical protein AWC38_SpisGene19182 [Stylophora pistillata]|uniref:Uncharacterized protein n=1 Tax=Stylophora pistillata TaxID=50429 RepID=A0A2B4RJM1_STYPI|nr:hypothetical protein AWC38_SpisGene19182 [Stylophora pistillata]
MTELAAKEEMDNKFHADDEYEQEQEDQNIPIQAFITPKQATIHEAPIVASGEGDKEKEKKTVTETVLNNDPLTENKGATEEDQEKQEDRELRQLWLTDLC